MLDLHPSWSVIPSDVAEFEILRNGEPAGHITRSGFAWYVNLRDSVHRTRNASGVVRYLNARA